jgi:hypothetical protein
MIGVCKVQSAEVTPIEREHRSAIASCRHDNEGVVNSLIREAGFTGRYHVVTQPAKLLDDSQ